MNNVVMLIRYYSFLVLLHLINGDCNRDVYRVLLDDPECLGQRQIVVNNVYGCRGNCESFSRPKQITSASGVITIKSVTHCKCCTAIELEKKTHTVRCRKKQGYKTFEIMSALSCACQSCGPDLYVSRRDNKRKRNRSVVSFDEWPMSSDVEQIDANSLEVKPTEQEGSSSQHSSQSTNYRDSDRLR